MKRFALPILMTVCGLILIVCVYAGLVATEKAQRDHDKAVIARFFRDFGKPSDCDCCTPCVCFPCECKKLK
jgi:hypothetical protein